MAVLQEQFLSTYPHEVLQGLECDLDPQISDHWLARLVRKPRGSHHPLRHLLLMHFLGFSAANFFALSAAYQPFGEPPWPCLNPVCRFYRQPSITNCQIVYPPSMGGHPTGIFSCACEFVYARSGPDANRRGSLQEGKIIQFGSPWEETLQRLWCDPSFSVNSIARRLGVDPLTVKRSAVRLGLAFTRRHEEALIQLKPVEPSYIPQTRVTPIDPASQREAWLAAMQAHSKCGTKALRRLLPGLYAWLYRHDRVWLQTHLPVRTRTRGRLRVNWEHRDGQLAKSVRRVAAALKEGVTHPIQITIAAIGRHIRQLALLQQHMDKLPMTAAALAEVVESREDFALRRIQWAAATYFQEQYYPQRWEFIRRAGLERVATWTKIEKAVHAALQTLKQHMIESAPLVSTSYPDQKGQVHARLFS